MTTWGGFGLIICFFIVTPIVILHRSSIPWRRMPMLAYPVVALGTYLGLTLGPIIFNLMLEGFSLPPIASQPAIIVSSFGFSALMSTALTLAKRDMEKQRLARSEDIQSTIARLKAKGTIHAPKGPYKHKNWRQPSTDHLADHETQPPRHSGYYGT